MGFESFSSSDLPELVRHKRSKSLPVSGEPKQNILGQCSIADHESKLDEGNSNVCTSKKKRQTSNAEIQNSLRQDILQLKKILNDQVYVRGALEKALGCGGSSHDIADESTIPEQAMELIKEIAVLELEVARLEQYLLSLYRKVYDQRIPSPSPSKKDRESKSPLSRKPPDFSSSGITLPSLNHPQTDTLTQSNPRKPIDCPSVDKYVDSVSQQSYSSQYECSNMANKTSPSTESSGKALRACHSQPLSMTEHVQNTRAISLAEHLGSRISDYLPETPNKLSEDMVKFMSDIYCKLADPPLPNYGLLSPTSSLSSMRAFSSKDQYGMWSPGLRNDSSFDNSFRGEGLKGFNGLYSTMVEVNCIHRDSQKSGAADYLLQNFRTLISRLESIDPRKLMLEEKLAFWINVHNALVMHAFLAYGLPQNNTKRMLLLSKAAYNVGGHIVSADFIQNSILGCRISFTGQWLRLFLSSRVKLKAGDARQGYAIGSLEPLLYFALSSGSYTDPPVRVYTPKRIFQELEAAKEYYMRTSISIHKDQKIHLPKIVESFAKDSGLSPAGLMEMIQHSLPESLWKNAEQSQLGTSCQNIKWTPHDFTFRYVIFKELVKLSQ